MPVWISYLNLIPLQVFDLRCAIWVRRQSQVPDSELVFDGLVLRSIPRIEISELAGYFGTGYLPVQVILRMVPIPSKRYHHCF